MSPETIMTIGQRALEVVVSAGLVQLDPLAVDVVRHEQVATGRDGALQPGYVGVRPKIRGPGEPVQDFRIDGPAVHGVPGLVNLFGIESPGLTSALAIAARVAALLQKP